jgi:flagellar hook-associated protein FlgK
MSNELSIERLEHIIKIKNLFSDELESIFQTVENDDYYKDLSDFLEYPKDPNVKIILAEMKKRFALQFVLKSLKNDKILFWKQ